MFPQNILLKLKRYLNDLRAVCCVPTQSIKPIIRVKEKDDFNEADKLKYRAELASPEFVPGTLMRKYEYAFALPSELEEFTWWDKEDLKKEHEVDSISVDDKKWLFYTHDKVGNFFLSDGSRKVEIEFPVWMEMHNVFETNGVHAAVYDVLSKCTDKTAPSTAELSDCFPDALCRTVFNNNPPSEAIEMAVLEMVAVLTKETSDYVENNHLQQIINECNLQSATVPAKQMVHDYLKGHADYMFKLAERLNLIKDADKIPFYTDIRDHLRHPDTTEPISVNPQKIYEDFCAILDQKPDYDSKAYKMSRLDYNTVVALNLESFGSLAQTLDTYVDDAVKKAKNNGRPGIVYTPNYIADLIQKGLLTKKQLKTFTNYRIRTGSIAHHNAPVRKKQKQPAPSQEILLKKIRLKLIQRHKRLDRLILNVAKKTRNQAEK